MPLPFVSLSSLFFYFYDNNATPLIIIDNTPADDYASLPFFFLPPRVTHAPSPHYFDYTYAAGGRPRHADAYAYYYAALLMIF